MRFIFWTGEISFSFPFIILPELKLTLEILIEKTKTEAGKLEKSNLI